MLEIDYSFVNGMVANIAVVTRPLDQGNNVSPFNRKLVVSYPGKDIDYQDFPWFSEVLK